MFEKKHTHIQSAEYSVGQVLNLPANGALRLAGDGTILTFTDFGSSTCNGPSAVWTGGLQPENRNVYFLSPNLILGFQLPYKLGGC